MRVPIACRWWLLLPAALLGAPPVARASCGDYVVIGGQPARGQHHSGMTPATAPSDNQPAPAPDHRRPCHGPSCSGAPTPVQPASPAPAPTGPHGTEWGWLTTAPDRPDVGPMSRWRAVDAARPLRLATSILHPPRRDASPSA
jgi:hypothetical protein